MKIITIYPRFVSRGGAQDMAISIAKGLAETDSIPVVLYDNPESLAQAMSNCLRIKEIKKVYRSSSKEDFLKIFCN